jgi:hypothetical protein
MSHDIANLMSVNQSLTSVSSEPRQLRLPATSNPLSKLDGRGVRVASTARPGGRPVLVPQNTVVLPEMATDVIDQNANFAVENVKCHRPNGRRVAGVGLGRWLSAVLGGQRAARL